MFLFEGGIYMNKSFEVQGAEISVLSLEDKDYISLTDMLKVKDGDFLFLIG